MFQCSRRLARPRIGAFRAPDTGSKWLFFSKEKTIGKETMENIINKEEPMKIPSGAFLFFIFFGISCIPQCKSYAKKSQRCYIVYMERVIHHYPNIYRSKDRKYYSDNKERYSKYMPLFIFTSYTAASAVPSPCSSSTSAYNCRSRILKRRLPCRCLKSIRFP